MERSPARPNDVLEHAEQARAWYAINYEPIVGAIESVLLRYATLAERSISIRVFVSGRLQILIQSADMSTGSHLYIRDVGTDFANLCDGSMDALTELRLVLVRTLVQDLPTDLVPTVAPGIERMISELLWGYAVEADLIERRRSVAPPSDPEPAYSLDPEWYHALLTQSPNAVAVFDAVNGSFLAGNQALVRMFGYSLAEFDALPNSDIYTPETPEDDFDKGVELMAGRIRSFTRETAWRHKAGHTVWCEMNNWLVRDRNDRPRLLVCTFLPVGDDADRESLWQRADKRFRYLAQSSADPTFIVGEDDLVRYASPATERTFGIDPDDMTGTALSELVVEEDRHRLVALQGMLRAGTRHSARSEMRLNRRDGQWRWFDITGTNLLDVPGIEGYSFQARDVSDRKMVEQLLAQQALFDPLTNLLNRRGLLQRLELALDHARANGNGLGVMYIDLDNFKGINDRFGHQTGDDALVSIAERLATAVGTSGISARLGGDEFVVVIEGSTPELAETIAERVRTALAVPIMTGSDTFRVGASIGLSVTTQPTLDHTPMSLLRFADTELYRAKAQRTEPTSVDAIDELPTSK
jgi:diguanylate cyclase (GGDEF)-like protein/PAS domain S-box-containing protein